MLAVLGRMLRWAQELGLLDRVPRIKLVQVPPQKFDSLGEVEYAKLRDAAASDLDMLAARRDPRSAWPVPC